MNNPNFRALCAELLEALENAIRVIYREDGTQHISTADDVITRADAALAAPQQGAPTLGDIHDLCEETGFVLGIDGANEAESADGLLEIVRLAIARYGSHTVPLPEAQP